MTPRQTLTTLAAIVITSTPWASQPTQIQYLSGTGPDDAVTWDFLCTSGRNSRVWSQIPIPSCWELQGFGTYNYGGELRDPGAVVGNEQGLYRHTFSVPAEWSDRVVRIVFDGSMTDTDVWINGTPAGPKHQGAFYCFRYDITDLLKFGADNLLEVTVAKTSANASVNAAEREADYWIFGGIFRPVWLEALPARFIDWAAIDAHADGSFSAEIYLGGVAEMPGRVRAQLFDTDGNPLGALESPEIQPGDTTTTVRGDLPGAKTWTAETPNLYRARFTLETSDGDGHSIEQRFGFRTVEVRENDGVYLNGTKIVLKGVDRHCFWPETGRTVSREQSYADARMIKGANLNAVRMSHYPPDRAFLEACDELGLYVLDELGGWQKPYDIPTGARLIEELVQRDVNHPCILFWDNGNEGGWKAENDVEFARWDPQHRAVLHPWAINSGIDTNHYENYASTVKLSAGPRIFMPTEFLHGLYDGGIGAGLHDYWEVMGNSPTVAGGFFWVWSDEGVVRTDQNGRIDNAGNQAPDGMVGPHREPEGSYYTVKEIWSPVQIRAPFPDASSIPASWDGSLSVENHYSFTNLDACSFTWKAIAVTGPEDAKRNVLQSGTIQGSDILPGATGTIRVPVDELPANANVLQVTPVARDGSPLWTWSWERALPGATTESKSTNLIRSDADSPRWEVSSPDGITLAFDPESGELVEIGEAGHSLPLRGPRLAAYRLDGRSFASAAPNARLRAIDLASSQGQDQVVVSYQGGPLETVTWSIDVDGTITCAWDYTVDAEVDLLGVMFDFPQEGIVSKRWLGSGPYRVYRNRLEGGRFDLHEVAYNDPIPGQTYAQPEFRGYFRDWRWLTLRSTEGTLRFENSQSESAVPFFGVYQPRDGDPPMMAFPETGISFLDVIPAIRTKFTAPGDLGPQSATPHVAASRARSISIRFDSP